MKESNSLSSPQTQHALARLLASIRKKYPDVSESQAEHLQSKVMVYVADGLSNGYDLALIKHQDDKTILKVLKLQDEED